jgi:amino acid adenylation domain-containing protein
MSDLLKRLADLSPEKRRLLELRLQIARGEAAGAAIRPRPRDGGPLPLSFAQQRLWLVDELEPGTGNYNIPSPLRMRGPLDTAALARALDALRARHESLRTTFLPGEKGAEPTQVIHPHVPSSLDVVDLSSLEEEARDAAARTILHEDANTGFDLRTGPLVRARLLRLAAEDHLLLLTMHHIVSDGWSMGVLMRELTALYEAFAAGADDPLPPLAVQYADYALWQREQLAGEPLEKLLEYWRGKLGGAPPVLALPTDRPRPAVESHRGETHHFWLPRETAERLREVAREEGTTLFAVLLAGLRTVLARHAGQDDVVLGTPIAGRTRAEIEGLVGFFVNSLALRTDLAGNPTFREAVRREKETTLGAFSHQELPFERLVDALKVERDLSRNPVFQVMFSLQNVALDPPGIAGLAIEPEPYEYVAAKFDLTVTMQEAPDGSLAASAEFATDLFDRATVERLADHLSRVLDAAGSAPDTRTRALPMLSPEERAEAVERWNATETAYPRGRSLASLFEETADAHPEAVALSFADGDVTYGALDARANRLAAHLRAHGAGPETRVALSVDRSAALVVAVLAIVKAGAAYVPLDASYPEDRLAFMLEDAGVSLLVVDGEVPAALASFAGPVVSLTRDAALIAARDATRADVPVSPETLAYVVYTSGSTGTPKGIGIPQHAVVRLVRETDYVRVAPDDRIAQVSNTSFDAFTFEAWGALLNGATLVGMERDTTLSAPALVAAIRERGVTAAFLTTALFNHVAAEIPDGFRTMRHLMFGGEASDPASVRRVLEAGPPQRLLNAYGPTESTTFAAWHLVTEVPEGAATVPIGLPLANTTLYVLDGAMQPVPLGATGELYIGGEGLARGYLARPGLTAERFVPSPFGDGARLYRTGDGVRRRPGGAIEFVERLDEQVKIRGFRIELGEVEAALAAHPAVKEACVLAREDAPGDRRLVAYAVSSDEHAATPAVLRLHLQQSLPEYMVPGAFVLMDRFPLTPNGKLDRRALPAPDAESFAGEGFAEPRGPVEEMLAAVWADVLRLDRVSATANFFELGGHSLLATQVVSRVREVFRVELPLRALFEAGTVRDLALRVEAAREAEDDLPPPIVPVDRDGPLPLSFAQERLWFLDQFEPGGSVYNMPLVADVHGPFDADALRSALTALVERHEALRATFADEGGRPVQRVTPPAPFDLPVFDLSQSTETEREEETERHVAAEAQTPFDLASGPLLRARLVRHGAERHVLLLTMHHIVSDGWSLGILFREVSALYEAARSGAPSPLSPLPVQYADFAVWQRRHLSGARLDRQIAYWRDRLSGAPTVLELPTDRPRPANQTFRGDVLGFVLEPELAEGIRALARREGATPFMALLAAFQVLLSRYARQSDVVVGSPIAGRNRGETEGLIGFFVNTLALRADLSADPSFRDLLAQVRETTLGAYAHQDLPFEKLVEELAVERSMSYTPIFQVMFALQNAPTGAMEIPGVRMAPRDVDRGTAKFDLTLNLEDAGEAMAGAFEYASDLFDRATVGRMAGHYARLLRALVDDPDARVSTARLLTEDEEALVVRGFNDRTARPSYVRDATMHRLFEAQVRATPDDEAVVHADGTLTYAQLNDRANRLARYLRTRGVGPDVRVGVLMERTPDLIVALYAVLKAGGAYVPLDPAYPAERVAFMLEDTAVPVLLTQERLVDKLPPTQAEVFAVDAHWARAAAFEGGDLEGGAGPDNLAYLIYTSGSTGRPKGVQLEHRSAVIVLQWMRDELPADLRRSVLASTSVCFDVSIAEIFGTLSWGGRIVLVRNALSLANLPDGHEVAMASMVPSAAAELLRMQALPKSLRSMNLGGEPVKPALAHDLYATGHVEQVVNLYGPSEDTTYTTALWIARDVRRMTVGRPVANTQIFILDRHFRPTPVGVPGELYIGGHGVTRGYHARPGMTAEKYIPNPFGAPGDRMYRTGDLARYLADGEIEYLGRLDHQIKIRGHRVEIGEVEAVLARAPGLEESTVTVREDGPGMARLVAYYVASEPAPTVSSLRAHVRAALPEYMVPSAWVRLAVLPHTPNGKVDKRALPAPESAESVHGLLEPRTPTETVLAGIWAEVLGVEKVGIRDSFFELGGHSLLATRVMSRLREALQVELPLRTLFEAATIEALAERVDAARREAGGMDDVPLLPVPRDGRALPLSFAQERLWFIDRLQPGSPVYNMPIVLRIAGAVDADVMRRALETLVARHESLRTTFARGELHPVQVIHPAGPHPLPVVDLSHVPHAELHVAAQNVAFEEGMTPFDLERGPLLRTKLLRLGAEEHHLLLTMHHVVSDGWSMGVFYRELGALYDAYLAGEEPNLHPLPIQYADYAAWQRAWLVDENLAGQLDYWRTKLEGAPPLDLPTDRPRPAVQSYRGARHAFTLGTDLTEDLNALARREGATVFMVMTAMLKVLLSRYAGQDDVVVGSPIAGRNRSELEGLIGFFINSLALRTDLSGDPTVLELIARVRETTLDAYAHQDLPFEKLVEELKVERSLSRHPVFQVSFSHQNAEMGLPESRTLRWWMHEGDTHSTKFDVTIGVSEVGGSLHGGVEYAADLFDAATIERMMEQWRVLMEGAVSQPTRRISELPRLLDAADRHRILVEWNRTDAPVPAELAHEAFSRVAAENAGRTALVFEGREITFGALEADANRLARHLRRHGVGPEVRVGLDLGRGPATVTAILAVLKAGGAYVPLDPAYPADRLAYMLSDAGISLLLTERAMAGGLPPTDVETLVLEDVADAVAAEEATAPEAGVGPESLAYVIYTSGSTGRPKGVLVPHRGIVNLAAAQRRIFDVTPDARVLQFASFSFDATVSEVFATLLSGAALVLGRRETLTPGRGLREAMVEQGVTHVTLPPSVLAALKPEELPALRTVIAAGEACSADVVARWAEGGRRVCNAYGPTESTVGAAIAVCAVEDRRPPIGPPLDNLHTYVLDEEMEPVPVGVPGELYVGGIGLARGYHGRAALTAEKFVPDPFGGVPGGRLYRTGDRVRWRRDAQLEFVGRVDEMVKIRGFRIEPGEIEALLTAQPEVRDALVVARTDGGASPHLVAYVVPDEGETVSVPSLREQLKGRLPEYMVPSAFVVLPEFPLSPNGKVDRKALPAPEGETDAAAAPQSELERRIAAVWAELLGLKHVGVHENFFEIGGHSLLLARMQERLSEALEREISMIDLFQFPTVSTLAAHLDAGAGPKADAAPSKGSDRGSKRRAMLQRPRR